MPVWYLLDVQEAIHKRNSDLEMGNALATCSDGDALGKIGLFSNKTMPGAVLLTFILQLAGIYVPRLNRRSLPGLWDLLIGLAFGEAVFVAVEFFQ